MFMDDVGGERTHLRCLRVRARRRAEGENAPLLMKVSQTMSARRASRKS
jgi:hypothetical protein